MKSFFLRITVIGIFFFACKKDKDALAPQVTIHQPYSSQTFNVFDTITVKGVAEDDIQLKSISISVWNQNNIQVLESITITPSSLKQEFNRGLPINDIHIESGNYNLKVSASDGVQRTDRFVPIYITGTPKTRRGVFIISASSPANTTIYKVDSTFSGAQFYKSYSGDYSGSALSSYFQTLITSGSYSGALICTDLNNGGVRWSFPAYNNNTLPSFFDVSYYDKNYYVSRYDGNLDGFDNNGIKILSAGAPSGYYPVKSIKNEKYLIAAEKNKTSASVKISAYYATSGAFVHNRILDMDVVSFCKKKGENVFVFGNTSDNQGHLMLYEAESNTLWEPYNLAAGKVFAAAAVDSDNYIIATESGIYRYQYSTGSRLSFAPVVDATNVAYDEVLNEIVVSVGNQLKFYDYSSGIFKYEIINPEPISDFHLWYNK